jgi:hypothetical protein
VATPPALDALLDGFAGSGRNGGIDPRETGQEPVPRRGQHGDVVRGAVVMHDVPFVS